jgi:calcium-dependent protein kinase
VLKEAYNEKCDVWSCGIVLYVLLTGRPPYAGRNEKDILNAVYAGALDISGLSDVSAEARDFANVLLTRNYRLRISATDALTHPFIQRSRSADPASGAQLSTILTNLKAFNNTCKLKDAIHTFIATQVITQADMKELRDSFRSIDKNGDGRISKEELLEKYRNTMPTAMAEQEVTEIMERVDTNHSGFIDYSEFLHASLDKAKHLSNKNMETTFKMFDKDNSGKISANELRAMLSSTSVDDQTWNEIIQEVDSNGDGEIDLREFESMVTKHF